MPEVVRLFREAHDDRGSLTRSRAILLHELLSILMLSPKDMNLSNLLSSILMVAHMDRGVVGFKAFGAFTLCGPA